jgi:hypothetical protein
VIFKIFEPIRKPVKQIVERSDFGVFASTFTSNQEYEIKFA